MYVVALMELSGTVEAEAAALAADLGTTAYEERLKLVGGLPVIVLTSAEKPPAQLLGGKMRARGQGVLAVDTARVTGAADMVSMRRFDFETGGLLQRDTGARLPFSDILALVRAVHRTQTETRTETQHIKLSLGKAVLTGGLAMTKKVTREDKSVATDRSNVLYLFRASGETPWLLQERTTDYSALGPDLAPSSMQNFLTTIARLRAAAPTALYDERLTQPGAMPKSTLCSTAPGRMSSSSASGVDLMASLIALWHRRQVLG
ncbi:MAG: hypothetical protein R3B70_33535 [Polyangiaceae bacterium]